MMRLLLELIWVWKFDQLLRAVIDSRLEVLAIGIDIEDEISEVALR